MCQLQNSPGHNLTCFIQEFDNIENPTKFRDLSVSGGKKAVESAKRRIEALASGTATHLEKRFTLDSILQDLEIFDPSLWPTEKDRNEIISYGNEELFRILNYFSHLFTESVQEEIKEQWLRLKLFIIIIIIIIINTSQYKLQEIKHIMIHEYESRYKSSIGGQPRSSLDSQRKENYREEKLGVGGEERHLLHGQE